MSSRHREQTSGEFDWCHSWQTQQYAGAATCPCQQQHVAATKVVLTTCVKILCCKDANIWNKLLRLSERWWKHHYFCSVDEKNTMSICKPTRMSYSCFSPFLCTGGSTQDIPERGLSKCGAYVATADCCMLLTDGQHGTTRYALSPFANYLSISYPA